MQLTALTVIAAIAVLLHFFWKRKTVAYTVHVQGRTEEAETVDFGVVLYDGESKEAWEKKINVAYELQEKRRGYNNDRMMKIMREAEEKRAAANGGGPKKIVGNS